MRLPVLAGVAVLAAACGPGDQPAPPPPRAEAAARDEAAAEQARRALGVELDALAAGLLRDAGLTGVSVVVEQDGHRLLAKGYGQADRANGVAAAPETAYSVASITKQFTAAAVLKLAEQGRLGLDDPLSRFVPELGDKGARIRIHHLLTHTSGLPSYQGFTRLGSAQAVRAHILRSLARRPLRFEPGSDWEYSNAGFHLLGLVVERAAGRAYPEFVEAELARPLGLAGTGYCEAEATVSSRAQDYEVGSAGPVPTDYWKRSGFFAAGGLCSSAADLAAWQRALEEGRVVGVPLRDRMLSPTRLADGLLVDYGYGTRLGHLEGRRKLGHTGGGRSNRAAVARYPEARLTVVVLANTEQTNAPVVPADVEARLARRALGLTEPQPEDRALPPERQGAYAGTYLGSTPFRIVGGAGGLRLAVPGRSRREGRLLWQGGDAFVSAERPDTELLFLAEDGRVERLAVYENGWFYALKTRRR